MMLRGQRTRLWGQRWLWGLFLFYLVFSTPAGSRMIAAPLMWGITPLQSIEAAKGARVIVVLDGSTDRYEGNSDILEIPGASSAMRALEAARVYKMLEEPLVIVSGGDVSRKRNWSPEASALRDAVVKLGVLPQHVLLDSDSQNTRAHALNLVRLLKDRGISDFVLVTSPTHMLRSILTFRSVGANPVPSPCHSPVDNKQGWSAFCPSPEALVFVQQAMHDYLGLAYYRFQNWL